MAKQNFLAGGYYGKLGDTVGQRWKNIRTIRSYVIPHNPKTPLQQANRKSFGEVVPYAQLGNDANFNCPAFDLSVNTQWAFRMQQGTELQRSGESGLNLIPLYPKNFVVPNTISQITINGIVTNTSISIQIAGDVPETKRQISLFLMFADGARKNEIILLAGESTDAQPNVFTCPCADTSEIDTATIYGRVCSRDDTVTDTITASVQLLCEKDLDKTFKTNLTLVQKTVADDGTITIVVATQNAYSATTYGTVSVSGTTSIWSANTKAGGTESGMQWGMNENLQAVNYNGLHAFQFTQKRSNATAEYVDAEINFNIELAFTNYHTDLTDAVTATSEMTTTATWQNNQPTFSIAFSNWQTSKNSLGGIDISFTSTADLTNLLDALNFTVTPSSMKVQFKDKLPFSSTGIAYTYETINVSEYGIVAKNFDTATMKATLRYGYLADPQIINKTSPVGATITWDSIRGYTEETLPSTTEAGTRSQYIDNMAQNVLTESQRALLKFKIDYSSGHWESLSGSMWWVANITLADGNGDTAYMCSRNGDGAMAAHADNLKYTINGVEKTLTELGSNIQIRINAEMSGNVVGYIQLLLTGDTSGTVTSASQAFSSQVSGVVGVATKETSAMALLYSDGIKTWSFE